MSLLLEKYIVKLKKFDAYASESHKHECQLFSYADESSPQLKKLRQDFDVDNIAKGDTVFDKTLSLMNWVHCELFYTGENITPKGNNTNDIMSIRKTGALFCWYQAIVLTEMLASIGIISRVVSCLPEEFDYDSHMAVLVYDKEKTRWFFVDPTFNTYFLSDNEEPLDISQIRNGYASGGKPLFKHITIDKQWVLVCNGSTFDTYDQWYSVYMAKNTFRFMSPAATCYDCLSDETTQWIAVHPIGYNHTNEYDEGKNVQYIHSIMEFMQKPEK